MEKQVVVFLVYYKNWCFHLFFGLVIDVKGNYIENVKEIASRQNILDKIVEISLESKHGYNPLSSKISSFEMASRLKQVLMVLSNKNNSDS